MSDGRAQLSELLAAIPDLTLVGEAEAAAAVQKALSDASASFIEDPLEAIAASGASCLALGPTVHVARGAARKGAPRPAAWWLCDGKLFLACNIAAPPALWALVEPSKPGAVRALRELAPETSAPEKVHRFFFGLLSDSVQGFLDLENQLTLSAYCDGLPLRLGSAAPGDGRSDCFDDPEHTSTFETLLSKSRITVSAIHTLLEGGSIVIGAVEYRPSCHAAVVLAWNAEHDSDFPPDMPLDVLGAVSAGVGVSLAQLEESITSGALLPPDLAVLVASTVLTASGPNVASEDEVEALLRRHMASPDGDVRAAIGSLAGMYGRKGVLRDLREV